MKSNPKKKITRKRKPFVKLDDLLDDGKFTEAITQQTRRVKWLYNNSNRNTFVIDEKLARLIYHKMLLANAELCESLAASTTMLESLHVRPEHINTQIKYNKFLLERNGYKNIAVNETGHDPRNFADISYLKQLREYFGRHDKTTFEHGAYKFFDDLIKTLHHD